jgi:hypothetical protein
MALREKIEEKRIFDLKNLNQIRDSAIQSIKKIGTSFFNKYNASITIIGEINENGITVVFKIDSEQANKYVGSAEKGESIEKLKELIINRFEKLKERISESELLQEISISFGLNIPMIAKNTITISIEKAD